MIPPVLGLASWRHGVRHPWQVLLATLGISLGVAVVTAVDLTKASATRSFSDATETVVGRTTHHVVGGPTGISESVYARIRRSGLAIELAPLIEARVRLPIQGDAAIRMLGIDPVAEAPFRGYWRRGAQTEPLPIARLMTEPATALLSQAAAARLDVAAGQRIQVASGRSASSVGIIGILAADKGFPALAGSELMIVDIATAQEFLGMAGRLSRIDLILPGQGAERSVEALLPAGTQLVSAAARTRSLAGMTGAFHTNLQALSLMALLVGMFLIYNSLAFTVVQRRRQFGMLRALGCTRGELIRTVLGEAGLLGLVGTGAGIGLGWLLAHELVGLVTRTINDLYFALAVGDVALESRVLFKAGLLGMGGSLVAAVVPAREAGRVQPRLALSRSDLELRAGAGARIASFVGLVLVGIGVLVVLLPLRSLLAGFTALFLVVVGFALTTPALTRVLAVALARSRIVSGSLVTRLAVQGVAAALSRTGVAAAALMLAVATTVGIGVMVASFRTSVDSWLGGFLRADYYLSLPSSAGTEVGTAMDLELAAAVAALPGVRHVSHVRHVDLVSSAGVTQLKAFQLNAEAKTGFQLLKQIQAEVIWSNFEEKDSVLVTESYGFHNRVGPGDSVHLRTATGERAFSVIGVYRDYGSDLGSLAMSRNTYSRHWPGDDAVNGIGIYASAALDIEQLRSGIEALAGAEGSFELVANRQIREASLAVFDRTFTITEVLRLLAAIIAFIGVFSALMAIQLERTRELGVLKAVGVSPGQLRGIVFGETAFVGTVAGLYAIPVGTVLALLLIQVINRRSFGWGMELALDWSVLLGGLLMAVVAALLAGIYPAARIVRLHPAEALRTE